MKKFFKRLFLISFIFFLTSHFVTKYINHTHLFPGLVKVIASLPLDFWEGREKVKMQIYAASEEDVIRLLKENLRDPQVLPSNPSPVFHGDGKPPAYVVLRCKNIYSRKWGDIKCYCSGFPYPIVTLIVLGFRTPYYHDIIFPYPVPLDSQEDKNYTIKTRWKNFWGM